MFFFSLRRKNRMNQTMVDRKRDTCSVCPCRIPRFFFSVCVHMLQRCVVCVRVDGGIVCLSSLPLTRPDRILQELTIEYARPEMDRLWRGTRTCAGRGLVRLPQELAFAPLPSDAPAPSFSASSFQK